MSLNAVNLLEHIITPTLIALEMHSPAAERLLVGTAAQQSGFDPFRDCNEGMGIYQISPEQHQSAWDNYLAFRPDLASKVRGLASQRQFLTNPHHELITNLAYSTAMAWIIYLQKECQLPAADDVEGLSHIWEETFCAQHSAEHCGAQQFAQWMRSNTLAA